LGLGKNEIVTLQKKSTGYRK